MKSGVQAIDTLKVWRGLHRKGEFGTGLLIGEVRMNGKPVNGNGGGNVKSRGGGEETLTEEEGGRGQVK